MTPPYSLQLKPQATGQRVKKPERKTVRRPSGPGLQVPAAVGTQTHLMVPQVEPVELLFLIRLSLAGNAQRSHCGLGKNSARFGNGVVTYIRRRHHCQVDPSSAWAWVGAQVGCVVPFVNLPDSREVPATGCESRLFPHLACRCYAADTRSTS